MVIQITSATDTASLHKQHRPKYTNYYWQIVEIEEYESMITVFHFTQRATKNRPSCDIWQAYRRLRTPALVAGVIYPRRGNVNTLVERILNRYTNTTFTTIT